MNHVNDPSYFYDAIEMFSFDYTIFVLTSKNVLDDYGRRIEEYTHHTIRGSLQSQGTSVNRSKSGNIQSRTYNFYCKSLYRIDIGDIIKYNHNYLICVNVQDYDEWGVREATLEMTDLASHRNLADYVNFLEGEKIV